MNVSRSNQNIIGIESVTDDESDPTVTVNKSKKLRNDQNNGSCNGMETVTDPSSSIRGHAKNLDLTRALAPPHAFMLSCFLAHAPLSSKKNSREQLSI